LVSSNSSKKQTKTSRPKVHYLEELRIPKRPFQNTWPLGCRYIIKILIILEHMIESCVTSAEFLFNMNVRWMIIRIVLYKLYKPIVKLEFIGAAVISNVL
jgi:hypothetical protein